MKMLFKWWTTWRTLPVYSWVKAASLYRQGRFEDARNFYEKGLSKYPEHPARFCARMDLAYCFFRKGELETSERHLRYVVRHLPHSREAAIRLSKLQMWSGNSIEAAWTLRRALQHCQADGDLVAMFLLAAFESGAPEYLQKEAIASILKLDSDQMNNIKLEVARASLAIHKGDGVKGRAVLSEIVRQSDAPFEGHVLFAEVLLRDGKIAHARRQLRRAMLTASDHPRLLALFAETYLQAGPFYNPEFARQLATTACQNSAWLSPRAMHTLAKAFYHIGDLMAALIVASKAKQVGTRRLGQYRDSEHLEELIQSLSTGTLA